jgi:hypothetical protein
MDIEGTKFGSITVGQKICEHDVVIRREIIKRKKKLSKKYYGSSPLLSKKGCEQFSHTL